MITELWITGISIRMTELQFIAQYGRPSVVVLMAALGRTAKDYSQQTKRRFEPLAIGGSAERFIQRGRKISILCLHNTGCMLPLLTTWLHKPVENPYHRSCSVQSNPLFTPCRKAGRNAARNPFQGTPGICV